MKNLVFALIACVFAVTGNAQTSDTLWTFDEQVSLMTDAVEVIVFTPYRGHSPVMSAAHETAQMRVSYTCTSGGDENVFFEFTEDVLLEKPKGQQQIERAVLETSGVNVDDQHRTDIAYVADVRWGDDKPRTSLFSVGEAMNKLVFDGPLSKKRAMRKNLERIMEYDHVLLALPWFGEGSVYFDANLSGAAIAIKNARHRCGI